MSDASIVETGPRTTIYRSYPIEVGEVGGRPTACIRVANGQDRTIQAETAGEALALSQQFIDWLLSSRSRRYEQG